jgi:hypothetical protein
MAYTQHIAVKLLPGTTPEQARAARARGWLYVFECWQENQKAAKHSQPGGPDNAEDLENDRIATTNHNSE